MKLLILDGNSVINRAYFGVKPLTNREGLYTHAIYGFLNILEKLEKEREERMHGIIRDESRESGDIQSRKIIAHCRRNTRRLARYGATGNYTHNVPKSLGHRGASACNDQIFDSL